MQPIQLEQFVDTRSLDTLSELMESISRERFTAKTIGVGYRIICHWSDKEIIRFSKKAENSRRRYSFVDYIWIKVVEELRDFGVEIPLLQKIASEMYEPLPNKEIFSLLAENPLLLSNIGNTGEQSDREDFLNFLKNKEYLKADFSAVENKVNYLYLLVADIIATKKAVSVIIFKNGDWLPYIEENKDLYSEEILNKLKFESHLSVSITNLVFSFMLEEANNEFGKEVNLLTAQEIKVLDYVAKGNYKMITVFYKSKKTAPLQLKRSKSTIKKIMQIFQSKSYTDFIVTDTKGNEIRLRPEKVKLNYSMATVGFLKEQNN
jgi:DNA-binding transcriptional MerR regulator